MGAAKAMPADKYSFAPTQAIFANGQKVQFDGVRTFAQIVTHTIQANYGIFGAVGGIKPDVDVKTIADLKSKDDIVKALAATFAFAHKAVANVTTANAFLSIRGMQTPALRLRWSHRPRRRRVRPGRRVPPHERHRPAGQRNQAKDVTHICKWRHVHLALCVTTYD